MEDLQYILTPDYAMKMLNINECMECKSPVVVCGETGVGKTFLVKTVSRMWRLSIEKRLKQERTALLEGININPSDPMARNIDLVYIKYWK